MGWASGSEIAEEVWGVVRPFIPEKHRQSVAKELIDIFEKEDADAFDDSQLIVQDAEIEQEEDLEDY